jgi:type IV pilus assembly protein PilB
MRGDPLREVLRSASGDAAAGPDAPVASSHVLSSAPPAAPAPAAEVPAVRRLRVGDVLLQDGAVTKEQLEGALAEQAKGGRMIGETLVAQGVITPAALVRALGKVLGVPGVQLRHGLMDPALLKLIGGAEEAERLRVIPMFKVFDTLTVAMAEPQALPTIG